MSRQPVWIVIYDDDGAAVLSGPLLSVTVDMPRFGSSKFEARSEWFEGAVVPDGVPVPSEPELPEPRRIARLSPPESS